MDLKILRKIGLSEGEIKVYSALLDYGMSPMNKIHEKTGIERRNIYDILNKLIEKGLISYEEENKRRSFKISHPNKIVGYLEEKKKELNNIQSEIKEKIPAIIDKFNSKKSKIRSEVYRGVEGIKAVWEDMLNYKESYFIGGGLYIAMKLPFFWEQYKIRIKKEKIKWYNLGRAELRGSDLIKEEFMETRFLPKEFSVNPAVIFIYGPKVAQVLWGDDLFAFVTESEEIAENYKKYHKYLWENVAKD